ncbi:MAG: transketolase [Myxococcota bacterium]
MNSSVDDFALGAIRALSMDAVQAANSGHPGTPMALAPIGWALFSRLRRHDPLDPEWSDRDRFVLSCGHASMLQYALLHLSGYELEVDDLKAFRQWGSRTPGHPEYGHTPGVETTTGPLGQGIANAVGMAMAERHLAARFNRPDHTLVDHRIWVIASDGDLMEGVAAEAASLAGHLSLGKLIVFWDDNRITIDGSTELTFTEQVLKRFDAYGWHTASVDAGDDLDALCAVAEQAKMDPRPSLIRMRTVIGWPSPNKRGTPAAHGAPLGEAEVAATRSEMKWPYDPFELPAELQGAKQQILARGKEAHATWRTGLEAYEAAYPMEAQEFRRVLQGALPKDWAEQLPMFTQQYPVATRKASGQVLAALARRIPEFCGGSADLAGSNNTQIDGASFGAETTKIPRVVHWGVREHAMTAAASGMALHRGVLPFAATFLVFSDYMKPAIRLAALMGLPVRYIFTHDSIGLGEDGPTHQPVEHLAMLRAIPGLRVFRPADANETVICWQAVMQYSGPTALILSRQPLPVLPPATTAGAVRGAYVVSRHVSDEDPSQSSALDDVVLVASGSEVHVALAAAARLQKQDIRARVVSMPSWEMFAAQSPEYQKEVLPKALPTVVVEAGVRQGWDRWVGTRSAFVTLEHFGASAPQNRLYREFGITEERVCEEVEQLLGV